MPTALITGGTDGIGLELARLLATRGWSLLLVGRRALDDLTDPLFDPHLPPGAGRVTYLQADLARERVELELADELALLGVTRLDLLLHNAACAHWGPPGAGGDGALRARLRVNLVAPVALTHALLPLLQGAGGKLAFVGAVAADLAQPDCADYAAAKAGLVAFARALRAELEGAVRVQVVHPGPVRTGLHGKAGVPAERAPGRHAPGPAAAARALLRALEGDRFEVSLGTGPRLLRTAGRLAPELVDALARAVRP